MLHTIALQNHTYARLAAFSHSERRFFATARHGPDRTAVRPASPPAVRLARPRRAGSPEHEEPPRPARSSAGLRAENPRSGGVTVVTAREPRRQLLLSPKGASGGTAGSSRPEGLPAAGPVPATAPELRGGSAARPSPPPARRAARARPARSSPPGRARPGPSPALTPSWRVRGLPAVRTACVRGPAVRVWLRPPRAQHGQLSLLLIPLLVPILIPLPLPLHMGLRPPRPAP